MGRQTTLATHQQRIKKRRIKIYLSCEVFNEFTIYINHYFVFHNFPAIRLFAGEAHKVEIIAHHGVLEDVPENTFAAFRRGC